MHLLKALGVTFCIEIYKLVKEGSDFSVSGLTGSADYHLSGYFKSNFFDTYCGIHRGEMPIGKRHLLIPDNVFLQ